MENLKDVKSVLYRLFDNCGIDLSDADWLLVSVLKISRADLNKNLELKNPQIKKIYKLAKKRVKGIPLSQILGCVNFYGFDFYVNKHCLSPRPETELLVEQIMQDYKAVDAGKISGLDIGTGSGAIAITLNKLANIKMTAVDISHKALRVAKKNNKALDADVAIVKSNLFKAIGGRKFDFIVSNPPYILSADINGLDREVKDHEPRLALDGGKDGLSYYKKIIEYAPNYLVTGGKIYFELGINQSEQVKLLLEKDFYDIVVVKDYNNIDRIIKATKK